MKTRYKGMLLALICAGLTAIFSAGCRKDVGNYDYKSIDSLGIGNVVDDYKYSIGTIAAITPELNFLHGTNFNENDFTFEWDAYAGNTTAKKLIHNGKNLDIVLPLAVGKYRLYYVVKQKSTGISWQKSLNLEVYDSFLPAGWFVLNDIAGKARLDYYEENRDSWNTFPVIYRDFTSLIKDVNTGNAMELDGKPVSLAAFHNRDAINTSLDYRLYINTDKETEWFNITTGFTWNKLRNSLANETVSGEPAFVSKIYPGTYGGAYAYKDHQLYIYHYIYSLYGTPINRIAGTAGTFPISEYFAAPYNTFMHAMFFDTEGKRFMRSNYSSSTATVLNVSGQGLNLASVGKDLVWMGSTAVFSGQVAAILKDNNSHYYLARINFPYPTATAAITINVNSFEDITDRLTGIATADKFVLDQQYGYLFYVSGNKLYQYDMDNKVVKVAKDYGSRKISMLKGNTLTVFTPSSIPNFLARLGCPGFGIIVGSNDEQNPTTSGTVDFYQAPALMGNLTFYTNSFTGLGKVIDVQYSEL
ncbi:PKD-like family lipoprotein [Pedobacter sp. MR2016-24]|uniref:PKD-like family lipoprotein n=1 Tax=Pedobacter sp. MR2016-24 TaxID=2994466 RepID=UPI0022460CFD|nr:PKD-like family lipoprotein [Pedobacter sp. MR2016-24]MCX2486104.1 PKD-like family lipoprotein [Pedobacter sp. MR2016-24]